ncbi:MAG: hypothetical protein KAJ70_02140 [Candidatus Omnitrophica bacterium]|nr:hypothetical protein [Candidatus Omnitrophota bacterium]
MIDQSEDILELFIARHQKSIFALALYLIGGDRDKAYDITVSSFVKVMRPMTLLQEKNAFLVQLAKATVAQCRNTKILPSFSESDFSNLSSGEKESLRIVKTALQRLPFDIKVPVLLRDQLHFSYPDISLVMDISERNARIQTIQAHSRLRSQITDIMNHE